jgi:hypothetical protein
MGIDTTSSIDESDDEAGDSMEKGGRERKERDSMDEAEVGVDD